MPGAISLSKPVEFVDAYIEAAGLEDRKNVPFFRSAIGKSKQLIEKWLSPHAALKMIRRRGKSAGILTAICCHSFRASGITNYLEHGGTLKKARQMAAHELPKTTKLYDRTSVAITLDEIERMVN